MWGESYTRYHARDWAENKSDAEIEAEIARCEIPHHYQWNEVGNAHDQYTRVRTLRNVLWERTDAAAKGLPYDPASWRLITDGLTL